MSAAAGFDLGQALRDAGGEVARVLKRADRRTIAPTVRTDLLNWAGWLRVNRGLSPATVGNYVDDVASFFERFSGQDRAAVDADTINEWQQYLFVAKRERARTRCLKLTALRMYYTWKGGANPTGGIKGPKVPRRQPRKYSAKQLRGLFGAHNLQTVIGRRDFALLLTIYTTGARRDELKDMNLSDMEIRERVGIVRFRGKGAKERSVKFGAETVKALRAWLADRDALPNLDRDAVWCQVRGKNMGARLSRHGVYQVIVRALRKARVAGDDGAMGLHRLRATFATDLYDTGMEMKEIQILMGHEDINTTQGYIAISERQLNARMPEDRVRQVLGKRAEGVPAWARRPGIMAKLEEE